MRTAIVTAIALIAACMDAGASKSRAQPAPNVAVTVARATAIPKCAVYVDAASKSGDGSALRPHKTIAAAIDAAQEGDIVCVAQGTYAEQLKPGEKGFTLAGGFQSGKEFKVRDSAAYVSKAQGKGGSFIRIADPGPKGDQLTAIDGFEITGYSQAILREFYEPQRFDVTNNFIHDNICADQSLAGAGFSLHNVSGTIKGNVIRKNSCGRGGGGFLNDATNNNKVSFENNFVDGNAGTEPDSAHGGGLYFFGNTLSVTGNEIVNNSVTQWGAGLYIGAFPPGNQPTTATMSWNVYRGNRAGDSGGGFFCDDGATCFSSHEVYDKNCGGNILVDGGAQGSGPTTARFDHITSVGALTPECDAPGDGMFVDTWDGLAADSYSVSNAIFWGNKEGRDIAVSCGSGCKAIKVSVDHSLLQTKYLDGSIKISFGAGIVPSADPLFVAADKGDFRLQSASPAAGKGGNSSDLGAYGGALSSPAGATAKKVAPVLEAGKVSKTDGAPVESAEDESFKSNPPEQSGGDASAKQAFDDAKDLGTVEAWTAFLESFPAGFHSNLARAYLEKLTGGSPARSKPARSETAIAASDGIAVPATPPGRPAVARGGKYMGFPEKFNRYYTDPAWKPSKTVYVSQDGGGDGSTRDKPSSAADAIAAAEPGTMIYFTRGAYQGGFEFTASNSGTYDAPVVLYAERKSDNAIGVSIGCGYGDGKTCLNLEAASYIAMDGFELIGGRYGVRAIGAGFASSEHSRGVTVLNSKGHDQDKDPFFTGHADWAVWENNVAYGAKKEDGHGFYFSNGSDWNIARFNETYGNDRSDFQINADPDFTCKQEGIAFDDPRCDAYAGEGEGEGGQGASDYFLVDGNYFHHNNGNGPNFTSVRRSVIRNNIIGPLVRHNTSFWQETDNPKLGSSDNKILHNIFLTTGKPAIQFNNNSTRNEFVNNVLIGFAISGGVAKANPSAVLMEVDDTAGDNIYRSNLYVSGKLEGREPGSEETAREDFSPSWFAKFPAALNHDPNDFTPAADSPLLGAGALLPDANADRNGVVRSDQVDLGPIERR